MPPSARRSDALYPSDLERAVAGFDRALAVLATHPGLLPQRLFALAADVSDGCPWNRRPRLPSDLPEGMRPPLDLPDELKERMRVLLNKLTRELPDPTEANAAAAELVALAVDLKALDALLRRTTPLLTLAGAPADLRRQPTDDELLVSGAWSEEHLITLGRIIEVSAGNEAAVRAMLGRALGLPDGSFANQRYADAVFLGTRVKDMATKLAAIAELEGAAEWLPAAARWAKAAANADERRNQLVHRSPALFSTDSGWLPGMSASRRSQTAEVLTAQALDVLRELDVVRRAGVRLMQEADPPEHSTAPRP